MESKHIEDLLARYWNCETSLEEEQTLRDYFSSGNVPESLRETADLFLYFESEKKQKPDESFDKAVTKASNQRREGKIISLLQLTRIAAGILVVVGAGYFVRQEVRKAFPPTPEDTYTDPKVAFEETKKALMMISKGFNKAQREAGQIRMFNDAQERVHEPKKETVKNANI
ncbi:MAG: hypothetical protein K1X47_17065 [Cyclobacteriaceae bacterium]|nr:hypothetical protein [Cyclobacteriaceae bacterium]